MPGPDLAFSYVGIGAVIAFSVLVTHRFAGRVLAYCGRNSIAVYLAFTLFMGPVRIVLLKLTGGAAPSAVALASAVAPLFFGGTILESAVYDFSLPGSGDVHFVTPLVFDAGVYLIVIGLALDIVRSLGGGIDAQRESDEREAAAL